MSDLALAWDDQLFCADLVLAGPELLVDDGLKTAVVVSLFTDRRALADDVIPDGTDDRRGWWADAVPETEGDLVGSRLWLLAREKQVPSVLVRAREYALEALAWLVEDGVAAAVEAAAEWLRPGVLALSIDVRRPAAPAARYFFAWEALR